MMQITIKANDNSIVAECMPAENLLEVLRNYGVFVSAPCGGNGKCGKCSVLVCQGDESLDTKLACQTEVLDGMTVMVDTHENLVVAGADTSQKIWGEAGWTADGTTANTGFGIAVDLGTTTIACCLIDRQTGQVKATLGLPNPQVTFGADVISRITACQAGNLGIMSNLVCERIYSMMVSLCSAAGVEPEQITQVIVAGNTVMEHILAGIDPTPIGASPFIPPTLFGYERQVFLDKDDVILGGNVYMAPCIAGYVGGDVVCDLVSIDILHAPAPVVILDLGTNGEMALGDFSGIVACATAAGPVFEGANIKFGMPAYNGAISKVEYVSAGVGSDAGNTGSAEDTGTTEALSGRIVYEVVGGGTAKGICGTGLIDAVAIMLNLGILDESGYLNDASEVSPEFAHLICESDDGATAFMIGEGIYVTQKDIRCLQLAKSAVCAGILGMLDHRGLEPKDVSALYIAGGFGVYMNLENAARVGLFPEEMLGCAKSIGNACLQGEAAALISDAARELMGAITERTHYMELSTSAVFNALYLDTMPFPD